MKYNFTIINFKNSQKIYTKNNYKIVEYYNPNNILSKRIQYDKFERIVDCENFDTNGNVIDHQHKEYYETKTEKGIIETYKSNTQEYIRKSYIKFIAGFKHSIEEFISKSSPENSYKNVFIYDLKDKLIDFCSKKI